MVRKDFLRLGALTSLFGMAGSKLGIAASTEKVSSQSSFCPVYKTPAIINSFTSADHRRRLENIAFGESRISGSVRKHLITSYIPGHAVYQPSGKNWEPDSADDKALANLRDMGVGLIQPWSDWSTPWGKNYLKARNPDGFRRFVKLAHGYGLKVIPYTSSQYFERTDENFKKEWAWPKSFDLVEFDYHLAKCSPASPDWRAYVMHRHIHVMDEFEVDGLYNDLGYNRPGEIKNFYLPPEKQKFAQDEVLAFKEGPKQDGAMADFLALLYAEVKRRNGIYKLHKEGIDTVYTDLKIYDYLWVGEANSDFDFVRESVKNYTPYVTPQRFVTVTSDQENETFINSIPFMQFPILGHGQPGEQGSNFKEAYRYWLDKYLPLVEEGTWCWIDITSSELFQTDLPKKTVATLFINSEVYLVLANYNHKPVEVLANDDYISVLDPGVPQGRIWKMDSRSMCILKLVKKADLS